MLIVRPPVKKSLVLRISVVAFVMVCGVFMCSIGLKQISNFTKAGFIDVKVAEQPCEVPNVKKWERSFVHFPKPTTFTRYFFFLVYIRNGLWATFDLLPFYAVFPFSYKKC